jgi:hypothetical protein
MAWQGYPTVEQITKELVHYQGVRIVAVVNEDETFVQHENKFYWLADNGGEVNVMMPNTDNEHLASVSMNGKDFEATNAGTIAYRIHCILRGETIDYSEVSEDVLPILAEEEALLGWKKTA